MASACMFRKLPHTQAALELILQGGIIFTILAAAYISIIEVGVNWIIRENRALLEGCLYILFCAITQGYMVYLYNRLSLENHGVDVNNNFHPNVPYECINASGDLAQCFKGNCNGKTRYPRSHHCTICGVCRRDFDHHCPWLRNCVTLPQLRDFVILLLMVPLSFLFGVLPVATITKVNFTTALDASLHDPWSRRIWWDWYGSWVVCAGPLGRWPVGMLLGFKVIQQRSVNLSTSPARLISEPHIRVAIIIIGIGLLSLFCLVLALSTTRDIILGQSTLERLRPLNSTSHPSRNRFICIPHAHNMGKAGRDSEVYEFQLSKNERLYDLGWIKNIQRVWSQDLRHQFAEYSWPEVNPTLIHRLRRAR